MVGAGEVDDGADVEDAGDELLGAAEDVGADELVAAGLVLCVAVRVADRAGLAADLDGCDR